MSSTDAGIQIYRAVGNWLAFAVPGASYTRCFERYALDLLQFGTVGSVARHLGVGWDMVKGIHKNDLKKRFDKPSLKNLIAIAIDEFYAGKKTKYYTVESRAFVKNSRWVLLKGNENLSDTPNPKHDGKSERQRLDDALAYNQPLASAYYLKEELRQ